MATSTLRDLSILTPTGQSHFDNSVAVRADHQPMANMATCPDTGMRELLSISGESTVKPHKSTMLFSGAMALALILACILARMVGRSKAHSCEVSAASVSLALRKYADTHEGCLPPPFVKDPESGERHSWRVVILPHLTYDNRYRGYLFGEPWWSTRNRTVSKRVTHYACPTHSRSDQMTNYVAVVGEGTAWPEPKSPEVFPYASVGENSVRWPSPKGRDVLPDFRTRIVLLELVDSDISWMEPRDVTLDEFLAAVQQDPEGAFYNNYVKGIRAIDGAGHLRIINPYDDVNEIRKMFVVGETGR